MVSLEKALKEAPRLVEKLRKKYGNKVCVGEIIREELSPEPGGITIIPLFVDGKRVGTYKESDSVDGYIYNKRYNGRFC